MVDKLTPAQRSVNMAKIKGQNTKPEMVVRRLLHKLGYRYRLHLKHLPGKPDVAFTRKKKAIFIQGCFWHQHELAECLDGRTPKSNTSYWLPKLKRNVERDQQHILALTDRGWSVLTLWECELNDTAKLTSQLRSFLGELAK